MDEAPELIAINYEEGCHTTDIGVSAEGLQFFLTTPFEWAAGDREACEYLALYLFDLHGRLVEAKIDRFGPRSDAQQEARESTYKQRLLELGKVTRQRINVRPFQVERFGILFGLIPSQPDEYEGEWVVEMMPGNYMAFNSPWDDGFYDT